MATTPFTIEVTGNQITKVNGVQKQISIDDVNAVTNLKALLEQGASAVAVPEQAQAPKTTYEYVQTDTDKAKQLERQNAKKSYNITRYDTSVKGGKRRIKHVKRTKKHHKRAARRTRTKPFYVFN